jgi:hypothetical protein
MREDLSFCCSHTLNLYTNGIEVWPSSSLVVVPFLHKWISRFPFQTGASQFTSATSILGTKNGERARGRSKYLGAPSVTPPIQSPEVRSNASPAASPPRRPPLRCLPRHANASPASASAYGPHATCTVPHPTRPPCTAFASSSLAHATRPGIYSLAHHVSSPVVPSRRIRPLSRLFNVRRPREPVIMLVSRMLLAAALHLSPPLLLFLAPESSSSSPAAASSSSGPRARYTRFSVAPEFPTLFWVDFVGRARTLRLLAMVRAAMRFLPDFFGCLSTVWRHVFLLRFLWCSVL